MLSSIWLTSVCVGTYSFDTYHQLAIHAARWCEMAKFERETCDEEHAPAEGTVRDNHPDGVFLRQPRAGGAGELPPVGVVHARRRGGGGAA